MGASSTKYLKLETRVVNSRNSDYSDPISDYTYTEKTTPTRYDCREVLATTGGVTYDLALFGAITNAVATNLDDTNFVDITFRNTANGANDNIVRVLPGQTVSLGTTITPGNDLTLTADTASVECRVEVFGTV